MFKVLMLNDDYTPMEFVVMVLKRFFGMDLEQATRVMLHVHQKGVGVCGIFPYEIAETKVNQVMDFARQNQHPLQRAPSKRHNSRPCDGRVMGSSPLNRANRNVQSGPSEPSSPCPFSPPLTDTSPGSSSCRCARSS